MLAKKKLNLRTNGRFDSIGSFRTWIEINQAAAKKNVETFRKIIGPKVQLWAVVKSNAYGHGIVTYPKLAENFSVNGFCVDSFIEGLRLRKEGIKKPILVLGPTLADLAKEASLKDIVLSVSNFEILKHLLETKNPPKFHLKVDTGMHRQGFFLEDLPRVIKLLKNSSKISQSKSYDSNLTGLYTHFASAKDLNYPTYTDRQFDKFNQAVRLFEKAGFKKLIKHVAATGGALINQKYHVDAVRVGIGLYGLWPAKELEIQLAGSIKLQPILSWKTLVSEVKNIPAGEFIGYDLIERTTRPTKIAILPIGYWHGLPRALSGFGEVLIKGKRARILGRVSMDLIVVDATSINCQVGDIATLIGQDKSEVIKAEEMANRSSSSHYEIVTRLNPLIERIIV